MKMKLNKKQLIEVFSLFQKRNISKECRAGQIFSFCLDIIFPNQFEEINNTECDMFYIDSHITNFINKYCDEEAIQYFYSNHLFDSFNLKNLNGKN